MPGQFIESQSSNSFLKSYRKFACASLVLHIRIYRSYSYWWNSEGVIQSIQKKISTQVTEMVQELQTYSVLTKLP